MTLIPLAALIFITACGIYAAARIKAAAFYHANRKRRPRP